MHLAVGEAHGIGDISFRAAERRGESLAADAASTVTQSYRGLKATAKRTGR